MALILKKLGEFFWQSKTWLVELLAEPTVDTSSINIWYIALTQTLCSISDAVCRSSSEFAVASSKADTEPTSALLRLPEDVIRHIFKQIDDLNSCICLCVTHSTLGAVGGSYFHTI